MKTNPNMEDPLRGYTGKISDTGLYRRMVDGKVIIQRCPRSKKKKGKYNSNYLPPQNKRFYNAVRYASAVLKNDEIKAVYANVARGFNSANSMAVKDYLRAAVIGKVVTTGYLGRIGYSILIHVENVVPVKSVSVIIESDTGEIIESGLAVMQSSGSDWKYITTRANPFYRGSILHIKSCDLPEHIVEWTRIL